MRLSSILCLLFVLALPAVSLAQAGTPQTPDAGAASPPKPAEPASGPATGSATRPSAETPIEPTRSLEPAPSDTTPANDAPVAGVDAGAPDAKAADAAAPAAPSGGTPSLVTPAQPEAIPSPGELGDRLVGDLPPPSEQKSAWTAPTPILTLHGYMRARGELQDHFWLGRGPNETIYMLDASNPAYAGQVTKAGLGPDPFSMFRPLDRQSVQTMCASKGFSHDDVGQVCDVNALKYANMRFRLSPQINLSEDIRIKSTFDILDNYVFGTYPQGLYGTGKSAGVFPSTLVPNGQLIIPRRVWAEVRNRDLGELRFGLMPEHWGLGMLYNAGNGLDDDYSTDVARVMATTKLAGFYLSAGYDFMNEGMLANLNGEYRPNYDAGQLDDLDEYTFSVVRRFPDEDEDTVLARGDVLLNGGAHFQLRHQGSELSSDNKTFESLNATLYTPDLWGQLRYGHLRLEFEAAWIAGRMRNVTNGDHQKISQLGAAFESELRLVGDKLGLYLYTGAATGDSSTEGLSSNSDFLNDANASTGNANNHLISTFRFNPSYRVDLILWRTIMQQVTGAWYMKPGVSYDFVRDNFGQLFGARVDAIYSRAVAPLQTWGNSANLGLELNGQIYWHSADGPDKYDGYHAMLQYGVLFPMRGLGYYYKDAKLSTAQTLRLVLGVVF